MATFSDLLYGAIEGAGRKLDAVRDAFNEAARGMTGYPVGSPEDQRAIDEMAMQAALGFGPGVVKNAGQQGVRALTRLVQGGEKAGKVRGTAGLFPESGGVSPQKEVALVNKFVQDARAGEPYSRFWYDKASKDLYRVSGENVPDADKLAGIMATTSSTTPVGANTMFGFKGWNQALTGAPIETGKYPALMSPVIRDITEGATTTGMKRTPYQQGLSVEWRPPETDLRPVNDIHQASGMIGKEIRRGLSPAEHAWLDTMNDRALAKLRESDPTWTSYQTQAAAWAPQRVKAGLAKDLASASKQYGDFYPEYMGNITREWTPGANTGHLPELLSGTPEGTRFQDILANALEPHVRGPQDTDKLARAVGALSDRTLANAGLYEGQAAPGFASQVAVGKKTGQDVIDNASAQVMDAIAAMHGILSPQQQVAWNYLGRAGAPQKSAGAFRIGTGGPMAVDELRALQRDLGEAGGTVQADPQGARGLIFSDVGDPGRAALAQSVREAAQARGGTASFHARSGNLFPENVPAKWSVRPYLEAAEAAGPRVAENIARNVPPIAKGVLETTEALAQQHGWTSASWYRPLMEGLQRGGLPEVRRLYEAGVVPVAVLAALGLGATGAAPDATPTPSQ
jgi:hypothetical protein